MNEPQRAPLHASSQTPPHDVFDVPEGYMKRRDALLQILVLPGAIRMAAILIAIVVRCSR